ncbi:MAG: hypothetical protein KBD25_00290 [Rickettsiaceae bacterium]|nr:hypothetical protein [Rickettsiaceae bacterium]
MLSSDNSVIIDLNREEVVRQESVRITAQENLERSQRVSELSDFIKANHVGP